MYFVWVLNLSVYFWIALDTVYNIETFSYHQLSLFMYRVVYDNSFSDIVINSSVLT